jgi:hypothetical protein
LTHPGRPGMNPKLMARINGVEPRQAGWFVRFVYWMVRRKLGRVVLPIKIAAHHPRLLRSVGEMEAGQMAARSVGASLKSLASVKAAMLIGCPF